MIYSTKPTCIVPPIIKITIEYCIKDSDLIDAIYQKISGVKIPQRVYFPQGITFQYAAKDKRIQTNKSPSNNNTHATTSSIK